MREHLDGRCTSEDVEGNHPTVYRAWMAPAASILAPSDLYFDRTQHKFCALEQCIVLSEI